MRVCSACNGVAPKFRQANTNLFFCNDVCQFDFIQGGGEKRGRELTLEEIVISLKTLNTIGGNKKDIEKLIDELIPNITNDTANYIFSMIDPTSLLWEIFWNGWFDQFKVLIRQPNINPNVKNEHGDTLLMYMVEQGEDYDPYIDMILKHPNIDVNAKNGKGGTALILAVFGDYSISMLLKHPKIDVNAQDRHGDTALMIASRFSHNGSSENIVKMLLDHPKINVNIQDRQGYTALMESLVIEEGEDESHNMGATIMLLKHPKINVNVQDEEGNTALMHAIETSNERAIIEIGSHPDTGFFIRNNGGQTALDVCPSNMYRELVYGIILNQDLGDMPKHVSKIVNLRMIRNHLCENLSNQANRADLVTLARMVGLPPYPPATTKDVICRDISDVLSAGHYYYQENTFRAQQAQRRAETRTRVIPMLDVFRQGLRDVAGIDPEGKTLQQLLDELNRLL
jgi:ankyrin repeat protein